MKKNNQKIILFFFLIISFSGFSQTFRVKVYNELKQPVNNCIVVIKDLSDLNKTMDFVLAKSNELEFNINKKTENILIVFKANGYKNDSLKINNANHKDFYNIQIIFKKNYIPELKEITVISKELPYKERNDTLTYNMLKFGDGTEVKLIDILSKLPGIEVNKINGTIKYKGKNIETILLDGVDLFGINYTIASKNLNIEYIEEIQAIENFSENPLLKGIENNEKTVLNINLKKGIIGVNGNSEIGAGLFNDLKISKQMNLTLLGVTSSVKSFGVISNNNIGKNLSQRNYYQFDSDVNAFNISRFNNKRIISDYFPINYIEKDYNFINNQIMENINISFKLFKKTTMRLNLTNINDRLENKVENINRMSFDSLEFTQINDLNTLKKPNLFNAENKINFTINGKQNIMIETNLLFERSSSHTEFMSSTIYGSRLKNIEKLLINNIIYTLKINPKNVFQVSIINSKSFLNQNNNFELSSFLYPSNQYYSSLRNRNIIDGTYYFVNKNHKINFSIVYNLQNNTYLSDLMYNNVLSKIKESSEKNYKYRKNVLDSKIRYSYNLKSLKFSSDILISHIKQQYSDMLTNVRRDSNLINIEPTIRISYKLNKVSLLNIVYTKKINSLNENYPIVDKLFIDSRTRITQNPKLSLNYIRNLSFFYIYNDMYNQFQNGLTINYTKDKGDMIPKYTIDSNFVYMNYEFLPVINSNININLYSSKYIPAIKSSVKININYSKNNYYNFLNSVQLRKNKGIYYSFDFNYCTVFKSIINFENTFKRINYIFETPYSRSHNSNTTISNKFKIYIKFKKSIQAELVSTLFFPNFEKQLLTNKFNLVDSYLKYFHKNDKLMLSLSFNNINNIQKITFLQKSDFYTTYVSNRILPRHFIFNVSFKF